MASGTAGPSQWRPDTAAAASYLDFLGEDAAGLFTEFLDPQTLSAAVLCDPSSLPPPADEATRKRIAADSDSSDEGAREGKRRREPDAPKDAARTKACREKARREKINERFAELATLIDPSSEPKSDKPSILGDAIKHVQQLRVENHQLKQLNKFLEERVAQYERERGQQLYQHSLMLQHGGLMPGLMQHGLHMPTAASLNSMPSTSLGGPSMAGPSGVHPSASPPLLLPIHAAQHGTASGSNPSRLPGSSLQHAACQNMNTSVADSYAAMVAQQTPGSHPGPSSTPVPQQLSQTNHQVMQDPAMVAAASFEAATGVTGMAPGAGKGLFMGVGLGMGQAGGSGSGAPQPQQHWVPPNMLDSKKDSLLRPPAA